MKVRHWIVAGTAFVSAAAMAAGDKQRQTQSEQHPQQSQAASTQQQSQAQPGEQREQHSGAAQNREAVKQAQEKLSQLGHDAGPADGIVGPKTQAAVKEFQQSKGLNETGQLDSQTLAALQVGESAGAAGPSGPAGQPASGSMSQDRPSQSSASERSQDIDAKSKSDKVTKTQ